MPTLHGQIAPPHTLTDIQRTEMYTLLQAYFDNVTRPQFEADLSEKDWCVVLTETATQQVRGFSTLMRLCLTIDEQPIVAFFSGDTIIQREFWGETELPRLWGRHVFQLAEAVPDVPTYWFLISSGYKTYRFLPVFFKNFYPTYRRPTPPFIKKVCDALAQQKFPAAYDPATGLIRFAEASPLRAGIAEVTPRRLKDPDIAFFVETNPGYMRGDQLACLVELKRDNITTAGRRMLG